MNKRLFTVIIVVTAISLSGIIITQFYWVKDALVMKNEQFYQNAHLGLKRVVNQVMALQNDSVTAAKFLNLGEDQNYHEQFIRSLDTNLIRSMINSEFRNLELCDIFYYGIYPKDSDDFIMISNQDFRKELLQSEHKAQISCIFQEEKFMLAVFFPMQKPFVFSKLQVYIILSGIFMLIVIAGFWLTARSYIRQKRLSEMKTDFVNNMTHEFKTPIATVSFTSELLKKNNISNNPEKVAGYADIIFSESQRLKNQVDQVLQVAILDRGDYKLKLWQVDVHQTIRQVAERFDIVVSERDGHIRQRLNAARNIIAADAQHIASVLNNLVDNANKYSPEKPEITISTHSDRKGIMITVEDRGIGMNDSDRKDIFKKFHRISTGNLHDVKGFGIGLFYVKTIIEAHGGRIDVKSKPGKGSTFFVWIPFKKDNKTADAQKQS
jgi:two-component system phosphate regulon sensor histidine kinase PhoR